MLPAKMFAPVAQTCYLASYSAQDVLKDVQHSLFLEVLKLTCIKPDPIANWTFFIPNVTLFEFNHLCHFGVAFRAIDISYFIELTACFRVASIYTLRAFNIF